MEVLQYRHLPSKNKYDKTYKLYLKGERVTPKETYDLLDVINLKITHKDEVIYEGAVSGEDGMIEHIDLGTYNPGDEHIYLGTYTNKGSKGIKAFGNRYVTGNSVWIAD